MEEKEQNQKETANVAEDLADTPFVQSNKHEGRTRNLKISSEVEEPFDELPAIPILKMFSFLASSYDLFMQINKTAETSFLYQFFLAFGCSSFYASLLAIFGLIFEIHVMYLNQMLCFCGLFLVCVGFGLRCGWFGKMGRFGLIGWLGSISWFGWMGWAPGEVLSYCLLRILTYMFGGFLVALLQCMFHIIVELEILLIKGQVNSLRYKNWRKNDQKTGQSYQFQFPFCKEKKNSSTNEREKNYDISTTNGGTNKYIL